MGKIHKLKPSKKQAEEAVRTLLSWAGDDPDRQGLKDTPARVARAYKEWFKGYGEDPEALLRRTFDETGGYDEIVTLRDIPFESFCEHHLAHGVRLSRFMSLRMSLSEAGAHPRVEARGQAISGTCARLDPKQTRRIIGRRIREDK